MDGELMDIFDHISPDQDVFDRVDTEESSIARIKTEMMKVLNQYDDKDRKRENGRLTEEMKALIKAEIAKIKPVQHVVERHLEKQVVRNIPVDRAVPVTVVNPIREVQVHHTEHKTIEVQKEAKKDNRKLVEEKTFLDLKGQIEIYQADIEQLKKSIKDFREILPMMGGGGVIGVPSPSGHGGQFLTTDGTRIYWVSIASGTVIAPFAIASFADGFGSSIQIGSGTWKAAGALSFTAAYTNGPATSGTVSSSGLSDLNMTNSYQGPTASAQAVSYPSVGGTVSFTLSAAGDNGSATSSITHSFNNNRYWGVSSVASGYATGDITGLANTDLVNSIASTFTVNPGSGQYILFAAPTRLGIPTFTVNSFQGGFMPPETVSVTNASGYTENYYVQRSTNSNLGSTTVTTS